MKKLNYEKGTGARDVVTKSCSLYFHYIACILKYFLSSVGFLLFIVELHTPSVQGDSII